MNIGIAILAAGASTRFGSAKQLAPYNDTTLVSHCVSQCRAVSPPCTVAVVVGGPFQNAIAIELADKKVQVLPNGDASSGVASSIKVAADWATDLQIDALLLVACDQVMLTAADYSLLIDKFRESELPICCASYGDTFGIPAIFNNAFFDALSRLDGDRGAKSLIAQHRDRACMVALQQAAVDVDLPSDLLQTSN